MIIIKIKYIQTRTPMCSKLETSPPQNTLTKQNSRKKLWQLHTSFHCSVIGTCLTLEELRFIAKNHLPAASQNAPDHELHSAFVYLAKQADGVIRQCQKRLDKKFNTIIKQSSRIKDSAELLTIWEAALQSGNIAGTYWMIVTHPATDPRLLERAFGEVHMLSHLSGASARSDIKVLGKLRKDKHTAEAALAKSTLAYNLRLTKKQNEIDRLKKIKIQLEQDTLEIGQLRKRVDVLESDERVQQLNKTIQSISENLYTTTEQFNLLKKQNQTLQIDLKNAHKRTTFFRQEIFEKERSITDKSSPNSAPHKHCLQNCPINNLEGRNILYVGGRANQCPHFKALVEENNGSFTYHDGGKEDSRQKLNGALAQADAILCPTDCVSHDAYKRVKQHCHKKAKQLIMISHSSLSSFTQGLHKINANSQHTNNI